MVKVDWRRGLIHVMVSFEYLQVISVDSDGNAEVLTSYRTLVATYDLEEVLDWMDAVLNLPTYIDDSNYALAA